MNLLVEFPAYRSKSESNIFLARKQEQEENNAAYRQNYGRSVSEPAVVRGNRQKAANQGKNHKNIQREIKPEKWSSVECQDFWNQLVVLRSSYRNNHGIQKSSSNHSISSIGTIRHSNCTSDKMCTTYVSSCDQRDTTGSSKFDTNDNCRFQYYSEQQQFYKTKNKRKKNRYIRTVAESA